jgi:hypothetical protein
MYCSFWTYKSPNEFKFLSDFTAIDAKGRLANNQRPMLSREVLDPLLRLRSDYSDEDWERFCIMAKLGDP